MRPSEASPTTPDVAIEWPLPTGQLIASQRDSSAPRLAEIADSLPFRCGSR
jgi:dTDP-4-dehydrorhamnose 3,5-epimerase-like enzyme